MEQKESSWRLLLLLLILCIGLKKDGNLSVHDPLSPHHPLPLPAAAELSLVVSLGILSDCCKLYPFLVKHCLLLCSSYCSCSSSFSPSIRLFVCWSRTNSVTQLLCARRVSANESAGDINFTNCVCKRSEKFPPENS